MNVNDAGVTGWDIGGVNLKMARARHGRLLIARSLPFEIQRASQRLPAVLRQLAADSDAPAHGPHAVTMTAELSQMFRTKRDGVAFVLDAIGTAFPDAPLHVYTVDGRFVDPASARTAALRVAASNWHATASIVAARWPSAILVDVGSTTTDIIPIAGGTPCSLGTTDPERLVAGELLYLGAVRTPVEAIVHDVPFGGAAAGVSAEGFALAGDVLVWSGDLSPDLYAAPTPDARPVTREFVRDRLARIVCGDRDTVADAAIDAIARHVRDAQIDRTARALTRVRDRHADIGLVVAAGIGACIAMRAAVQCGMAIVDLAESMGVDASRCAPAAAVALLLEKELGR